MVNSTFREQLHEMADRMADYLENVEQYPVRPDVSPGEIKNQLPERAPESAETFQQILEDVDRIILPGITHWQHPRFYGYFPANTSEPSVLAEMLTAAIGAQCMSWLTSPAATELEQQMMEWLIDLLKLPPHWQGCIQSTASEATLVSLLTAREQASSWSINKEGFKGNEQFVVYASEQVHSSIDKAVRIAGFGEQNLCKIPVDESYELVPEELLKAVKRDIERGKQPLAVVSVLGTTASTAIDPIPEINKITTAYNLWHHVDAAYAGTAMILPEYQKWTEGLDQVDSFVFNPHKWMGVQFDCSTYFVRDAEALKKTFSINPAYLQTGADEKVNNYRDWGIPLGRRFRALKLWFVLRMLGAEGIRSRIRSHIEFGQELAGWIKSDSRFEMMAPAPLNLVCFRYHPPEIESETQLNELNRRLLERLNQSGKMFLTHAELNGRFVIRWVVGQTHVSEKDITESWKDLIVETEKLNLG